MLFRKSTWIILCVFAECFRQDPKKQALQTFAKEIEQSFPSLVCRGAGVEEGDKYLYFQITQELDAELAEVLATQLKNTLEVRGVVLEDVRCILIFQEKGLYYQIRLLGEKISIEQLADV